MRELNYQLKQLCRRNHDGSYRTQVDRERQLTLMANQLQQLGFFKMKAQSLKPKHVEALVSYWKKTNITVGTIKNRLAHLRWWAQKVNRNNVMARSNSVYGVADRQYVTNVSKAKTLTSVQLDQVTDPHVRMSLELQQVFGLRREEAIKFQPGYADRGDAVVLKASWTKGGKQREIPVRTEAQREVLNRARQLAGNLSLIPSHLNYRQQMRVYERQTANAGLSKMHGLRHAYAQQRYFDLTGWQSPVAGGSKIRALSIEQKLIDRQVRLTISHELGHERIAIVSIYLGS